MTENIFDSHAHYDDGQFDEDRDELLSSLKNAGVCGVINCGCCLESSAFSVGLSEKYDFIYAAVGIHPQNALTAGDDYIDGLKRLLKQKKVVAVGEIGLDYHYEDGAPEKLQKKLFIRQIILAKENGLPVIVHDRDAHGDILDILKQYRPQGVVHCFSGSVETAREIIKLGMYIGLGGAVTFKNAKKPLEVAKFVPNDRLLIETDCPYMAPVPFRGKRNDSSLIPHCVQVIADIRRTDAQSILDMTKNNAMDLFKIE